uniref:Uncharacterized protein n=1 Tax=Dulem virus 165 TaxID=3145642 RepID=A0AAU8B382_9VIRU
MSAFEDEFERGLFRAGVKMLQVAQNSARSNNDFNSLGASDTSGAYSLKGASTPSGESSQSSAGLGSILGSASAAMNLFGMF